MTERDILQRIAAIPLWRDTYPDGPDIWDGRPNDHVTVEMVWAARRALGEQVRDEK